MTMIKIGAAALALTLSLALPVESPGTAQLFGAPTAHAGVLGKIKGAAKKVGGAGKFVGKKVGAGAKQVGKSTVGMGKAAGKYAGEMAWYGVVVPYGKIAGEGIIGNAANGVIYGAKAGYRGLDRGLGAVQDAIHDKYAPKPAPRVGKPLPKPPAGQPGSWGGKAGKTAMVRPQGFAAPNHGIAKPNLALGRDRSAFGRPVGVGSQKSSFASKDIRPVAKVARKHRR